jgi:hypothetical protein
MTRDSITSVRPSSSYNYYFTDGMIARTDSERARFQVRSFLTGEWTQLKDPAIVGKILRGARIIENRAEADRLFELLKKNASYTG